MDGIIIQSQRSGDAHAAVWRIDSNVQVLDVLADYLDRNAADFYPVNVSTHAVP
jgi:hypothetical protein